MNLTHSLSLWESSFVADVLVRAMFIVTTPWSFNVFAINKKHAVSYLKAPFKCFVLEPLKRAARFLQLKLSQGVSVKWDVLASSKQSPFEKMLLTRSMLDSVLLCSGLLPKLFQVLCGCSCPRWCHLLTEDSVPLDPTAPGLPSTQAFLLILTY